MNVSDIQVDKTYVGAIDYKRGLGSHRKVLSHDVADGIVTFKVIVGPNPPAAYVSLATMGAAEFAAWTTGEAILEAEA